MKIPSFLEILTVTEGKSPHNFAPCRKIGDFLTKIKDRYLRIDEKQKTGNFSEK
jgi:hypothetical protein